MSLMIKTNLIQHSIDVILRNQANSGAYLACPDFPNYQFSWFRDGSFIAYAMDLSGEFSSSNKFHHWVTNAIIRRKSLIQNSLNLLKQNQPLTAADLLHTRYTVDGEDVPTMDELWPNFQLDGLGTWLWGLEQHQLLSGQTLPENCLFAAGLVADYLTALWRTPCYDCWEEFPNDLHPHTLAAIYGGLAALSRIDGRDRTAVLSEIRTFINTQAVYDGYFVKKIGSYTVDASLLGLAVPYQLVDLDDPRFTATLERIESSLVKGGGVHRYPTDTYYGGGEWILLAAWLGWAYALRGQTSRAEELLAWIESQADSAGNLPEQVPASLNDPNYYQPWIRRWGEIAKPLLWSHAQYLILNFAVSDRKTNG